MKFSVIFVAVLMTACSSMPMPGAADKTPVKTNAPGLAPQTLADGACGLFLWTRDEPRSFIFFQQVNRPAGLVYLNGASVPVTAQTLTAGLGDLQTFSLRYESEGGNEISVNGVYGEDIEGGRRIASATIKAPNAENWQQIIPANGVYACR